MRGTKSSWSDERVATLRKLWAEGLSASQIAKQLGGVTRNAVIGKADRLGLVGRSAQAKPDLGRIKSAVAKKVARSKKTEAAVLQPIDATLTIETVRAGQCRYLAGEPSGPVCGREAPVGPFCAYHRALCYQPSQRKMLDADGARWMHWVGGRGQYVAGWL